MIKRTAIILTLALLQLAARAQQTYRLDVKKSKILWDNRKTMGGHYGYILFNSGTLNYSASGRPTGGLFSIDMNSMRSTDHPTGNENQKVDKELRTRGFFDVDYYPVATMKVKQMERVGNSSSYTAFGDLTIKGVANPNEFTAIIKQTGNTITATAQFKIHRLLWGIDLQNNRNSWEIFSAMKNEVIPDEVAINLELTFSPPTP